MAALSVERGGWGKNKAGGGVISGPGFARVCKNDSLSP